MLSVKDMARTARREAARIAGFLPGSSGHFGPPRRHATSAIADGSSGLIRHAVIPARNSVRPGAECADPPYFSELLRAGYQATVKDIYVAELPEGRYWGRQYGYIIDRHDSLITDLSLTLSRTGRHDGLQHLLLPTLKRLSGVVAVMNSYFAINYHHWLLDAVPRFEWIRRAGFSWAEIDYFVLPNRLLRWHYQVLERLGIHANKIICSSSELHLQADLLVVPSHSTPDAQPELYDYPPEALQFVRRTFLEDNPFRSSGPRKRILVSREKANGRRLVQGERAARLLQKLGFEKVLLEDHSLLEQAALLERAECVVMPTGGNIANFVFCQPGTVAIELFSPTYLPDFMHAMVGELGLRYYALVAQARAPLRPDIGSWNNEDIDIPPERLEAVVRDALRL